MSGGNGQGRDDAFYALVLSGIGAPVNQTNLNVLRAWVRAESGTSGTSASWNPLNTTQNAAGATKFNENNGFPVKNYPDEATGVAATVKTLKSHYYVAIVAALRASNPLAAIAAIVASPWDGHYGAHKTSGGSYDYTRSSVYAAYKAVAGKGAASVPGSGTGATGTAFLDPTANAIVGPDGTIYTPASNYYADVPEATRKGINVVTSPGYVATLQKKARAGLDPGAVQEITPGTVIADTASSVAGGLAPIGAFFGWFTSHWSSIGVGLIGVALIIAGIAYANRGNIASAKQTIGSVAKVAAVA